MKTKPIKIAFIWDYPLTELEIAGWDDGLKTALSVLQLRGDAEIYRIATDNTAQIYTAIETIIPDFILCWGSLDRPSFGAIRQFDIPTGLCFAGGSVEHGNKDNFDIIFVENQLYLDKFKAQGYTSVVQAFGVNDVLFLPTINLQPHFEAIYPAAFIGHKRQDLFAKSVGRKGLAVGGLHPSTRDSLDVCLENGVMVMPKVPYEVLPFLIAQSQCVLITAQAGSQRTMLEAMAMNKPVIVMSDNDVCVEYAKESGIGLIADPLVENIKDALVRKNNAKADKGREYVTSRFSAERYANALLAGIRKLL